MVGSGGRGDLALETAVVLLPRSSGFKEVIGSNFDGDEIVMGDSLCSDEEPCFTSSTCCNGVNTLFVEGESGKGFNDSGTFTDVSATIPFIC